MPAESLSRYWHTLRWLRPVQFYGRVWFRLRLPRPDLGPAPPRRTSHGAWARCARVASMTGPDRFRFLNEERRIADAADWNRADRPKLWLYNAHYCDDLNAADAGLRGDWHRALIARWVAENPPATGNGWAPYPTSLRIVNWVKWALAGNALDQAAKQSLAVQARWLRQRLEIHLLGNHLWANAKALLFVGAYFDGEEATAWRTKGFAILRRELGEQILADGGHFERSPMYHAIALEDLLDLVQLGAAFPDLFAADEVARWRDAAMRMLSWLRVMSHPDGGISFFNDAAFAIAPSVGALTGYAATLGLPTEAASFATTELLSDSGYARLNAGSATLIADVAPIGPDYLPGHAHADTLSFELSIFGQRVVVNGGTSRYGLGPERLRERQTAAHSTVEVAGEDSSEVWSGFRVARRARPFALQVGNAAGQLSLACSHDGYTRLSGKPVHRREWLMDPGALVVTDTVTGGRHPAVARFILHPQVGLSGSGDAGWVLALPAGQRVRVRALIGRSRVEPAHYAPEFGKRLPTQCLAVDLVDGRSQLRFEWN